MGSQAAQRLRDRGHAVIGVDLRDAEVVADRAKVVVLASNSATTTPAVPGRTIRALLAGDIGKAVRSVRMLGPAASAVT
jgi:hypothetical protein